MANVSKTLGHVLVLTRVEIIGMAERKDMMTVGITFRPDTAYMRNAENTTECTVRLLSTRFHG